MGREKVESIKILVKIKLKMHYTYAVVVAKSIRKRWKSKYQNIGNRFQIIICIIR